MTKARAAKFCAALLLGLILPCVVTCWFFTTKMVRGSSLLGEDAPEFEATTISGDVFTLSGYDGRRLALLFVNFDCPACVEQLGCLDKLRREISNPGVEILAVSESSRERTLAFSNDFTLSFPLVIDQGSMRKDYHVSSEPTLVLVDEGGIVRFCKSGLLPPGPMGRLIHDFAIDGKIPVEALVETGTDESAASAVESETPVP